MIDRADYDDVLVTVAHPFGDVTPTLTEWIRVGQDRFAGGWQFRATGGR